mmetsp:Transcript_12919/g.21580  ORF Transcript_12919/g.21580 Transcript_12919/m.21580 type:complete len:152 (-) Transcript_12919:936-1391(-)
MPFIIICQAAFLNVIVGNLVMAVALAAVTNSQRVPNMLSKSCRQMHFLIDILPILNLRFHYMSERDEHRPSNDKRAHEHRIVLVRNGIAEIVADISSLCDDHLQHSLTKHNELQLVVSMVFKCLTHGTHAALEGQGAFGEHYEKPDAYTAL